MRLAAGLALLCLADAAAWAAPTGLNTVPTADVVPVRQCTGQLQNGNTVLSGSDAFFNHLEPAIQSQFGLLAQRAEGGLDIATVNSPSEYRPVFNLKVVPLLEDYYWPAVAVGVAQVGPGFDPAYYLAATKTLNYAAMQYQKFRAHHRNIKLRGIGLDAGVLGTGDVPRGFVGTDIELTDWAVLQSDWTSGHDHFATFGGVWVIDQQNSIQAAFLLSNSDRRNDGVLVQLTHQFSW